MAIAMTFSSERTCRQLVGECYGGHDVVGFRRKKEAREAHRNAKLAKKLHGLRAKLHHQKRFKEKVAMKKTYGVRSKCARAIALSLLLLQVGHARRAQEQAQQPG